MQTVNGFLNTVRWKKGFTSDYQLAKFFKVSTGRIANNRRGGNMSNDMAVKIAAALELHPLYPICIIEIHRAKDPELKAMWAELATKFAKRKPQ